MADPVVVNELLNRARQFGLDHDVESEASNRSWVNKLIQEGTPAPVVENMLANAARIDSSAGFFGTVADAALTQAKAEKKANEIQAKLTGNDIAKAKSLADAGLGASALAIPGGFSGGGGSPGPSTPTLPDGRSAFDMLKDTLTNATGAEPIISITPDGTAIARVGTDEYAYNINGKSPILIGINGKSVGSGGAVAGGNGGGTSYSFSHNVSEYIPNDVDRKNADTQARLADIDDAYKKGLISGQDKDRLIAQQNADTNRRNSDTTAGQLGLDTAKYGFQSGPQFQEGIRQYDNTLGENARQADQNAAVAMRGQNFNLAPALGNLALDQNKFRAEVLRNPADFLARSFVSRGATSPVGQVTMADILNGLSNDNSQINSFLDKTRITAPTAYAPRPAPAYQVPTAPAVPTTTAGGLVTSGAAYNQAKNDANAKMLNTPGMPSFVTPFAKGGFTQDKKFLGNEKGAELFLNPTGAPIAIVDHKTTKKLMKKKVKGFESGTIDPSLFNGKDADPNDPYVGTGYDAMGNVKYAKKSTLGAGATMGANGIYSPSQSFGGVQIPGAGGTVSQADLQAQELANRPPAVNGFLTGGAIKPLSFGFALPSIGQYNLLTPDERTALRTSLAVNNQSLDDLTTAMQQQSGATGDTGFARRAF